MSLAMCRPSIYLLKPQSLTNGNMISLMGARAIFTTGAVPGRWLLSVIVMVLELLETDQVVS